MSQNFFFAGAFAALVLASGAQAADLPRRGAAPPPAPLAAAPQAKNWTGFYAGVNGGVAFDGFTKGGKRLFKEDTGGLIGGTAGYNYQVNQFVVGVEGDLDYSSLNGKRAPFPGARTKATVNSLGTVRARVGFAADKALVYATGGYAGGNVKSSINDTANGIAGSDEDWRNGYVVGGGIEYAFTNNISAKAEYNYSSLEEKSSFSGVDAVRSGVNISTVKTGLNYHF